MPDVSLIIYVLNIVILIIVLILGIRLVRNASLYNYAIGDDDRQTELKFKILKAIVAISILALASAAFNLFFA